MIKAGNTVKALKTVNLSMGEDEVPLLVIKAGDRMVATTDADSMGFVTLVHLPSQFENIRLHKDDVTLA